ncbi:MAG: hypothetical protein HC915_04030 [Anaerolineae bacterium]|nr:hypothetical protein [Anaerolineae bacterium]
MHELAHQWQGNAIRLGAWQDIWLNEGFASYAEMLANEAFPTLGGHSPQQIRAGWEANLRRSSRATPLAYPLPHEMFSLESYDKGAWVLHMLRVELDDLAFFEALRAYIAAFSDDTVTTLAFFQFMERHSGRDLTSFRAQWLEQPGLPRATLYWQPEPGGVALRLCSDNPNQRYTATLPLQFSDATGRTQALPMPLDWLSNGATIQQDFSYPLNIIPAQLVVDPGEQLLEAIRAERVEALPNCSG